MPRNSRKQATNKKNTTCSREGEEMALPQDGSGTRGSDAARPTGSWDPYEIWLTRVKQPRDQLPRRAAPAAEARSDNAAPVVETKPTEPLLRGVS
jgi:hypothetical protein